MFYTQLSRAVRSGLEWHSGLPFYSKTLESVLGLGGEFRIDAAAHCFFALFSGYDFAKGLRQSLCPVCRLQQSLLQRAGAGGQLRASVCSLRHVVLSSMTD